MRTKIFILAFLFLLVLPISKASYVNTCENVKIEVNLEALDEKGPISLYQNPEYREGDVLIIKNINIFNVGTCNVTPLIKFTLIDDREDKQEDFNNYYYSIRPNIKINESYSLNFIEYDQNRGFIYRDSNNTNKSISGKYIKPAGVWKFNVSTSVPNWAILVNGEYINPNIRPYLFRVYTINDLELRELTKNSNSLAKNAIIYALIGILISLLGILTPLYWESYKNKRNQENLLISLLIELSQVAKTSEINKKIFIENITTNKNLKTDLKIKSKEYFKDYLKVKNKGKISEILRKDKRIAKSIKFFCDDLIKNYSSLYSDKKLVQFQIPSKFRRIDDNFYLKNLDNHIYGSNKEVLMSLLIDLTERIRLINSNLDFVNNNHLTVLNKNFSINPWFSNLYKVYWSLEDLDKKVYVILEELLKGKKVKGYFNSRLVNDFKNLDIIRQRLKND